MKVNAIDTLWHSLTITLWWIAQSSCSLVHTRWCKNFCSFVFKDIYFKSVFWWLRYALEDRYGLPISRSQQVMLYAKFAWVIRCIFNGFVLSCFKIRNMLIHLLFGNVFWTKYALWYFFTMCIIFGTNSTHFIFFLKCLMSVHQLYLKCRLPWNKTSDVYLWFYSI